ncbi:X-linked retinitis pigmentosa GTPase regulator-interacting protein 1 [Physocladia obscura]|uniref:X-linked retinitis pigmentosa GTPase regulator-interacting protein 1 n=1 Tax=Physocladia obscura TaxID=109957 RepID=A0AAD5SWT2_9FUNG|nr:X-linked retinitis pigmentosa GTPase regulator-interacting protein 1 [Physocladia obscura]
MAMPRPRSAMSVGLRAADKLAEDEMYALRDENMILKRKLNMQDDRAKKLTTKVQRLSEDLLRNKELMAGDGDVKSNRIKPIKGEFRNIEEAYDLIEDLRGQLKELAKENVMTRNKMQYFRTLHEAESKKRTPYDHIPPRIQAASQKKRLHPSLLVKARPGGMASARTSANASPEPQFNVPQPSSEEMVKLEELNGILRLKLNECESEIEKLRQESERSQDLHEKDQRQNDVDRAALQLELSDARKRERELAGKFDTLDERFRAMLEAHQEALRVSDELNSDLKEERRRCVDMEHELKKASAGSQENSELLEIIEDLKEEKRLLEQEQANLLDAQFNRDREEEYQHEIEQLRENLRKHISELAHHLDEKRNLYDENESLKEHLRELRDEKHESDRHMFEIQQELDELREKMNFFCKNGEIDLSEIEEALSIVRLRKERGISLDFLMEAEELYADKELLQDLRVQYADCIHELEKVRKLLYLQEHINKDYKLECEELNRKMEALKNGYELRLEEDSRLLDLRSNKISLLEGQLKSIVYGTAKIPGEVEKSADQDDDMVELATALTGQNLIEIHLESALISDEGIHHIKKLGIDMEDSAKLTAFIHYDFFEFETQVSPMGLGQKPVFNYTAKYKVYTDDFFLQYLQSKHTILNFAISNGLEFYNVATCSVIMKELTDPDRTERLRYYADLTSTYDDKTIVGKIDFGLRVRLPMAQAIRSFKERTVALNLLTVSDKEVSTRRFRPRSDTNDLVIRIIQCAHLKPPAGRSIPAVFASFQFYIHDYIVTDTVRNSTSPMINFLKILPLPMTSDLDRYLRTSSLTILVLDDNDGIEDFQYGSVSVPLLPLALGEKIFDEYFLNDGFGATKSKITVSLEWSKPYKLNVVPLISLLDENIASVSGRSNKAVHSQDDVESETQDSKVQDDKTDEASESMDKYERTNKNRKKEENNSEQTFSTIDESIKNSIVNSKISNDNRTSVTTETLTEETRHVAEEISTIDERESRLSEEKDNQQRNRLKSHDSLEENSESEQKISSKDKISSKKFLQKKEDQNTGKSRMPSHKSLNDLKKSSDELEVHKLSRKSSKEDQKGKESLKSSNKALRQESKSKSEEILVSRKSSRKSLDQKLKKKEVESKTSSEASLVSRTTKNKPMMDKSSSGSESNDEKETSSSKSSGQKKSNSENESDSSKNTPTSKSSECSDDK